MPTDRARIIVILVAMVGAVSAHGASSSQPASSVPAAKIQSEPLTIAMNVVGRFAHGDGWSLHVNPAGDAELTIQTYPQKTRRQFKVSNEQLAQLRQALVDTAFFDLRDAYGQEVVDGSTTTLAISVGEVTREVRLKFLMNWVAHEPERLREPARALRVTTTIRGWFDDPAAVDLRKYDAMVIHAAESSPAEAGTKPSAAAAEASPAELFVSRLRAALPANWQCWRLAGTGKRRQAHGLDAPLFQIELVNSTESFTDERPSNPGGKRAGSLRLDFYGIAEKQHILKVIDAERIYSWDIPIYYGETTDYIAVTSPAWINNGVYTDEAKRIMAPLDDAIHRFLASEKR
jgi:hypothetical protein